MSNTPSQENETGVHSEQLWKSLHIFNIYRLIAVGILNVIFFLTPPGATTFGQKLPFEFGATALIWLVIIFLSGFASRMHVPSFRIQAYSMVITDILFITVVMHASGGITSGLGVLLLITIAASGVILEGRLSFASAALATLAILAVQGYAVLTGTSGSATAYTQSGLLGVGLFAIALVTHIVAQRIRISEALAKQRGDELADLSRINELIIQQIGTGIILVDNNSRIRLANAKAQNLLETEGEIKNTRLRRLSQSLDDMYSQWRSSGATEPRPFRSPGGSREILPRFSWLGQQSGMASLIFLDDTAQLSLNAQQVKLASLGRLTASIAHEIRNPLSAISHAGQLINESEKLHDEEKRLANIIVEQVKRLDATIESVLSLSRKKDFKPELIDLSSWMKDFYKIFLHDKPDGAKHIKLDCKSENLYVQMDPTHLGQVLCNLCENGLRYARQGGGQPQLSLTCSNDESSNEIHIDVLDNGPGIDKAKRERLFEPFYTTESTGTGLGLYIARELCELNHARLKYINDDLPGAHFRLSLHHYSNDRKQ